MIVRSESGDYFKIPEGQEHEFKLYREAVDKGDEEEMLKYEEGRTGWEYFEL